MPGSWKTGESAPSQISELGEVKKTKSAVPGSGMTGGEAPEEARVERMTSPGKVCCARIGTGLPDVTCAPNIAALGTPHREEIQVKT